MTWTHEFSCKLPAPPSRVFAALTDPRQLTTWFAEHAEVTPGQGGRFRFWGRYTLGQPTAAQAGQTITRWEPDRALTFDWQVNGVATEVRIALAAEEGDGNETRLTLHHEVRGSVASRRERELIDDHWRLAFGNLTMFLSGQDGILRPDFGDPAPEIRITLDIAAPRDVVFRALIEPDAVSKWFGFGQPVDIEPRVGGKYHLHWKYQVDGRDVEGGPTTILEFVEGERLVLAWPDWRGDTSVTGQRISFTLESVGEATRLTFVHSGFERPADLSDFPFGWRFFLGGLASAAAERAPDRLAG